MFLKFFFSSKSSPLALSDIIVLDYIVDGNLVKELEGNETISLNFSKKVANSKMDRVSNVMLIRTRRLNASAVLKSSEGLKTSI